MLFRSGEAALNFKLERASTGGGLRVASKQEGVRLFVDGREIGALPQEVHDLAPGEHKVVLKGGDKLATEERTVRITADETKDLGTIALAEKTDATPSASASAAAAAVAH